MRLTTIIILLFSINLLLAGNQPYTLGLNLHQGMILNHADARRGLGTGISLGTMYIAEASIHFHTLGTRAWHKYLGYPRWGMSAMIINTGNTKFGGTGYAWLIYKSLRLVDSRYIDMTFRIGGGLCTFSDPYHEVSNPTNLWISAPVNASLNAQIEVAANIHPKAKILVHGAFIHFSNGAIAMPNLGINFATVGIGVKYTPHPERIVYRTDTNFSITKRNFLHLTAAIGYRVLPDYGTTYFPIYTLGIMYGRRCGTVSKINVGLDYFRDLSLLDDNYNVANKVDISRVGLFFGYEAMFGKLSFPFGMGYYLYKKTSRDADFYIKVGLRYHYFKNLFAQINLKTHWGQADNIEWTFGYSL
ncbi:MAG: acyloxyacyl hydrolase [Cytophagales bacterium]|nr:acyloxyacyl hydrolase [Cytophagales bacterium]